MSRKKKSVSYTHLDVYKRQSLDSVLTEPGSTTGIGIYSRVSMVSLITDGPDTYWCIKQYDRGNRISFVANKGITARRMKYKAKARDVTRDVYKRQP